MTRPYQEIVAPKISDFYRPIKEHHSLSYAEILDGRLRVLAYGLLPYEHLDEAEHRKEVRLAAGYLQRRLASAEIGGRVILNNYRLAVDWAGAISFSLEGPENRTAEYIFGLQDKIKGWQTTRYDDLGSLTPRDISDRPYAVGRVLATALDVCSYKDTQALAFQNLLDILKFS